LRHTARTLRVAFHDKVSLDDERNAVLLESGGNIAAAERFQRDVEDRGVGPR
jgi:hypothetical protein